MAPEIKMPKFVPWTMGIVAVLITAAIIGAFPWAASVQSNVASMNTMLVMIAKTTTETALLAQQTREDQLKQSNNPILIQKLEANVLVIQTKIVDMSIELEKIKSQRLEFERRLLELERKP